MALDRPDFERVFAEFLLARVSHVLSERLTSIVVTNVIESVSAKG